MSAIAASFALTSRHKRAGLEKDPQSVALGIVINYVQRR